ncbi:MAG: PIN domain-containing protein [Myxococcota bacterium]
MIVVDSSVWVASFRSPDSALGDALRRALRGDHVLLAAPVRIEILAGASRRDLPPLRRVLDALPSIFPTEATWGRIERFVERAAAKGQRFGVADLLIGGLAAERDVAVWSLDLDFRRMAGLGFVKLHA